MSEVVRVLFIEDSAQDAALIQRELRKAGFTLDAERVATADALSDALAGEPWDIVLADFELPGFDGFAALRMVRAADAIVPCIVVSGRIGEEMAVDAMRNGAADFVPKDRLLRLAPVVQRELREAEVRRARLRDGRRIAAQQAIASLLASNPNMRVVIPRALEAIAKNLDWDFASFWRWDGAARLLRCTATWASEGLSSFESETLGAGTPPGSGMVGRAFQKRTPIWIRELGDAPAETRLTHALSEGLHGALVVPVPVSGDVCCAVELLSRAPRDRDAEVLETTMTLAAQLGQAIDRESAWAALRESEARKAAVLETSLDGVVTADHRGRILEFNSAAERMFGYSRQEAVGQSFAELMLPASLRDTQKRWLARYLATGDESLLGRRVELPARRKDRSEFPAELTVNRVDQDGPPVFTSFIRDVTESVKLFRAVQSAEARQRVLAEAGATLMESLDTMALLPRLAKHLAGEIADWCTIHLVDEGGVIRQVAAAHRMPDKSELLDALWQRRAPARELPLGPTFVLRRASPQLVAEVSDEELRRLVPDEEELALVHEIGVGSYLGVPLVARGTTLGALSLGLQPRDTHFGADDLELAMEIGRRCAVAIDNGRLYREVQDSLRARDDFIVIAAHELQTPLTPLRLRAQELDRRVADRAGGTLSADEISGTVRAIDRSSRRLSDLVERLLDVSRVIVGRVELERSRFDSDRPGPRDRGGEHGGARAERVGARLGAPAGARGGLLGSTAGGDRGPEPALERGQVRAGASHRDHRPRRTRARAGLRSRSRAGPHARGAPPPLRALRATGVRPALRRVRAGPVDRAPHRRRARRSRRRVERTGRRITLLVRPPARQLTGRREPEAEATPRRRRSASFSARVVDKRTEPGNRDGPSLEAARGAVRTHGKPRQRRGWNRIGRGATKDLSTDLQCGPISSKGIGWNPGIARAGDPDWRLRSSRAWSVNMGSASSTLSETEA